MSHRLLRLALWSGLAVALAVVGYLVMNTTFMPYDDEGFVLISLRNYLAGLRLYDDVFSQYGPWPYVYHQIITTLGGHAEMTHMLGRAITLLHWVAMSLLCGGLAWRLTRSQLAAFVTVVLVFGLTWQTTAEPSHPGSHIGMLVALAAVLITLLPEAKFPARIYGGLGVVAALLLLTKINVGLLLAAGVGGFALRHTAWPPRWRPISWLGPVGLLALPWVLVGSQLHLSWALSFAVQFTLATAGLLWVTPPESNPVRLPARAWPAAVWAALATLVIVVGWVCLRGTSLNALVQTVLIDPLRMPARFAIGIRWYPETWVIAALGGLVAAKAGHELRHRPQLENPTRWLIVILRSAAALFFLWHVRLWPTPSGIFHFAAYVLPLLPLFLVPLDPDMPPARRLAQWGAAAVALPQVLHAFPVAGSQLAWSTFLGVPLLVAGLWETGRMWPALAQAGGRRLVRVGATAFALASAFVLGLLFQAGWDHYRTSRPLDLPGAGDIRPGDTLRQTLRLIALNAGIHADLLFSRQGMYSHNIWSGVPTPTARNATHWFWLLNEAQQQEIIARLDSTPRTALITCPHLDDFLIRAKIPMDGPLQEFVQQHYHPLFEHNGFVFSVPLNSRAVAFGRYEALSATDLDAAMPPVLFRGNVLLDGQPASIRLQLVASPWENGPELLTEKSRVFVQAIDREGRPFGDRISLPSVRPLQGLYQLSVFTPRLPAKWPWQDCVLTVRDASGAVLSESVY